MLSGLIVVSREVVTRINRTLDGEEVEEPSLGRDPVVRTRTCRRAR